MPCQQDRLRGVSFRLIKVKIAGWKGLAGLNLLHGKTEMAGFIDDSRDTWYLGLPDILAKGKFYP